MDVSKIPSGLFAPRPLSDVGSAGPKPLNPSGGLGPSFTDSLKEAIGDANSKAMASGKAATDLMTGSGSVHQTMIAMQDAAVAMDMVVAVRNKVLEAYQEVMRMPV